MKSGIGYLALSISGLVLLVGASCPGPTDNPAQSEDTPHPTTLKITLFNDSCGTYIAPKFGVCPNGMPEEPHYFVEPPAVVVPGESVTYTTDQVAGATDGSCVAFPTAFTVGIPGWGYGPTSNPDTMTYVDTRFVGIVGAQFHCGDTINLRWSNCDVGSGPGHWTSEVVPASGNPSPTAPFFAP